MTPPVRFPVTGFQFAVLAVLAALVGVLSGSGCSKLVTPGKLTNETTITAAQDIVWHKAYGRSDSPPQVYIVATSDLTCTDPSNDEPGFNCPTVGCRQGCTGSPVAVHVAEGAPWSATTLAHEDEHAREIRDALATILMSPRTFDGYASLADRNHTGPAWQPGGDVDRANQMLVEAGL